VSNILDEGGSLILDEDGGVYAGTYLATYAGAGPLDESLVLVLAPAPAGTELAYAAVSRASDDTTLANDIQITRAGGVLQEVTQPGSIVTYLFPRTYTRTDVLLLSDSEANAYAQWVLYVSETTETRFEQLAVDPLADVTGLFPQVLGREIGDRIQVYNRPPGLAAPVVRDCFIRGIQHDIDCVNGTWLTTWTLQDAARYAGFLIMNDPVKGQLDSNLLGY